MNDRRETAAVRSTRSCRLRGWFVWLIFVPACQGPTDPPAPPGGGAEYVLDTATFQATVAPLLAQYGCRAAECHGGGIRGTYELSPEGTPDADFDFEQSRWQVDGYDPLRSPLLQKPLSEAAGGSPHSWEPFDSTDHPGYRAIRDWILAGEFR